MARCVHPDELDPKTRDALEAVIAAVYRDDDHSLSAKQAAEMAAEAMKTARVRV